MKELQQRERQLTLQEKIKKDSEKLQGGHNNLQLEGSADLLRNTENISHITHHEAIHDLTVDQV